MRIIVKQIEPNDSVVWDAYVNAHPQATLYHLYNWKDIIEKTYGHKTYYLIAEQRPNNPTNQVVGILPLVHIKHFLFGNGLISIPFFDLGGILADNDEVEKALLSEAIKLAQKLKAKNIELRHITPISWINSNDSQLTTRNSQLATHNWVAQTCSHKVRMLLALPESSEELMKSFKSKLRSQIKKPMKEGLKSKVGGLELIDAFYEVFLVNMRDLGSPIHSKKLMLCVLQEFPENAKIVLVYKGDEVIACSLIVGFKDTLENPWASALRKYSRLSPNMLLYWTMQKYACDNGFKYFDFGRSSPDEGTYKFKKQWGAKLNPLYWHYISLNGQSIIEETPEKSKFDKAIQYWQKLPVSVTKIIGPMIRKHIGL
ncbi:MAG: FemAB family PEP-CTERM system-associated protein [Desulfobacteraceae bacterium]|nr:FemAB family PEP-CTERM system-associated protein [Desulfobacteraceae bacterium]MBC2719422.1 FemAB family PEP-CTERM system-associated protein [Desulfobacteraceae bacterium]